MRPVLTICAMLLFLGGCDAFIPDVGGERQECSGEGTCKEGLTCRDGVCCRTHWEGDGCRSCPPNWDAHQDCNACTGNWDPAQDCNACLGHWDIAQNCTACLPHWQDNDDDCGTCEGNRDISQNCSGCLGNWDPAQECNACLYHWEDNSDDCGTCPGNWDATKDCNDCVGNWDPAQECNACLNHWEDNSDDCGTCPGKWDAAQDCAECLGNRDPAQNCTVCRNQWVDNSNDCGTCPGNWDEQQDCAECLGNWDEAQNCTVCSGNWVDNNDDCGSCPGNWDPNADCAACLNHWEDNGDDCGTCPINWDPAQECNACAADWFGELCEKVTDCNGQPDFTLCEVDTTPHDYYYDICVQGSCTSPGCDVQNCNAPGPHFTLADTGQRQCYNETGEIGCTGTAGDPTCETTAYCGQDAQYGWDAANQASNRFHRNEPVLHQPIVTDFVTGLVWQGCADDFTGADCSSGTNAARSWRDALDHCDNLYWGGFNDWHLPDEYELLSSVDYNRGTGGELAIDPDAFPATPGEHFWTSSTAHGDQAYAVAIEFGLGSMSADHKDGIYHTRCVRNGSQVAGGAVGPRYTVDRTDEAQPVVTDNVTGLDWQGCLDGMTGSGTDCTGSYTVHNWMSALTRCQELVWGGHDDWYLPDIKQLHSITDNRSGNPAVDLTIFPGPPDDVCWSSTTLAPQPIKAWVVKFSDRGLVTGGDYNIKNTDARAVRCVRGGL